ncbi:MAG: acyltransferase family protein [Pseudomonadota bacterium]
MSGQRINWIDQARGLSIILVVIMHSTLGVEKAMGVEGWMHQVVAYATPFRIPAFFLISGLLLASALRKPLGEFLDKRVVTLLYLYVVWLTIQFGFKAPGLISEMGTTATVFAYLKAFVQPFGTLWFIYVLPIFFVISRATMHLPKIAVLGAGLIANIAPIHTGWMALDQSAAFFFYFYLGHIAAPFIQRLVDWVMDNSKIALLGLTAWAIGHGLLLGYAATPVIHVAFALAGAMALITVAALLRYAPGMEWLRWIGRNTIVIYLGFFLPMAIARTVMIKLGIIGDVGTISLLTSISAIIGAVIMYLIADKLRLAQFFYRKPNIVLSQSYLGLERRNAPRTHS